MSSIGPLGRGNRKGVMHELLRIDDIDLRLDSVIQLVEIVEVSGRKAKVKFANELSTDILYPFLFSGSSDVKIWNPPNIGDKCLFLSISGNLTLGFLLPEALFPSFDASNRKTYEFIGQDGFKVTYDKTDKEYIVSGYGTEIKSSQDQITMTVGSTVVTIDGTGLSCNKEVSDSNGTMTEMRNTYNTHTHPGDSGGTTGPANQPMT